MIHCLSGGFADTIGPIEGVTKSQFGVEVSCKRLKRMIVFE